VRPTFRRLSVLRSVGGASALAFALTVPDLARAQNGPIPPLSPPAASFQGNIAHTGAVAWNGPNVPARVLWKKQFPYSPGGPLVVQDRVYGIADFAIYCLDLWTGKVIWQQGVDHTWAGLAYDRGLIIANRAYANYGTPVLYAFDAQTGAPRWQGLAINRSPFMAGPAASNGRVFLMSTYWLTAYSELDGKTLWNSLVLGIEDESLPAIGNDVVYVSGDGPQTYAVQASTGLGLWYFSGPGYGGGASVPVLYQGSLYVGLSSVTMGLQNAILRATDGTLVGQMQGRTVPALSGNRGLQIQYDGVTIVGFDPTTYATVWKTRLPFLSDLLEQETAVYQPFIVGNRFYVLGYFGNLYGYDLNSGALRSTFTLGWSPGYGIPPGPQGMAFEDGVLVVPNGTTLQAIQMQDGRRPRPSPIGQRRMK